MSSHPTQCTTKDPGHFDIDEDLIHKVNENLFSGITGTGGTTRRRECG